jgi:preprotein translocase subunit SecA
MLGVLNKIFGSKHEKDVRALRPIVDEINALYEEYGKLSDDELRAKTGEFRARIQEALKETEEGACRKARGAAEGRGPSRAGRAHG